MAARVFLVHGWSVRSTATYQALHLKLAAAGYRLHDVALGRYVSLDNDVEIRDLARAMHRALGKVLGPPPWPGPFHVVTHSTGALVFKYWMRHHYRDAFLAGRPLRNVVFLAPPHFGSRLAHHGRSMLAHVRYLGDTGRKILKDLELGSPFSWEYNGKAMEWGAKRVRPFSLIGDRVKKGIGGSLAASVFPAHYEAGSDMVVRVSAGNLNFRRIELDAVRNRSRTVDEVEGSAFGAFYRYTHSGDEGIMASITRRANPASARYLNLKWILAALAVSSPAGYARVRNGLARVTAARRGRRPFAQLDFLFRDGDGKPIDDYRFELGYMDSRGRVRASAAVAHTHKNKVDPSRFTVFVDYRKLETDRICFMRFRGSTETELVDYLPKPYEKRFKDADLARLIVPDRTTRVEVVLGRTPRQNLFVFHPGDSGEGSEPGPKLHVKWNRRGDLTEEGIPPK